MSPNIPPVCQLELRGGLHTHMKDLNNVATSSSNKLWCEWIHASKGSF